ncbi:tubulin beta chain-like [Neocloeon triangulifer]|uniref:tubulin beta chain-like n=1 Tax=Neocloeon triangulifer TaxID=2078957 RepID=UPI00286F9DDF|nr:tubulin beta chain-like [Neocloeon triangulifer]
MYVSYKYWKQIAAEHGIDLEGNQVGTAEQLGSGDSVFKFNPDANRHIARAILLDLEPGVVEAVRSGAAGRLFQPANIIYGQSGAGNNWAKGHYTEGAEIVDSVLDVARHEADDCDVLQGFQLVHSLGGGTGSGLGTLMLSKLKEEFPDRIFNSFSVAPSAKVSDTVVEPYNAVFTLASLIENSEGTFLVDNEALYNICHRTLGKSTPTYSDLNGLVAQTMAGVTASLRFPGQLNSDLRKLAINLVPFPRLHFYMSGYAPLTRTQDAEFEFKSSVRELMHQLTVGRNFLVDCDPNHGRYLTMAAILRGNFSMNEVETEFAAMQKKHSAAFVPWVPNNVTISSCAIPPIGRERSATVIGNNSAIAEVFKRLVNQFEAMFAKRAYLHWFTGEGMDLQEFHEASKNVRDLISEYQQRGEMGMEADQAVDEEDE